MGEWMPAAKGPGWTYDRGTTACNTQSKGLRPSAPFQHLEKKYFEVGSCSNLGDAQARRLGIRIKGENGNYFAHTLNNTVVAPPRMLIAFFENNLQADGSVKIPEPLQPYMGGQKSMVPPEKKKSF